MAAHSVHTAGLERQPSRVGFVPADPNVVDALGGVGEHRRIEIDALYPS